VWVLHASQQGVPAILAEARSAHARTLIVKAAEGSSPEAQFSGALLAELRASGFRVCAWSFDTGDDPAAEASAAVPAAATAGCLVVDAEAQYDGRYGAAQAFVRALRSRLGPRFPLALAGEAEVLLHPRFPYSVFLGPGGFDVVMPQVYWVDFGVPVARAFALTIPINSVYGRAVVPVGQLYGAPSPTAIAGFRSLAAAYGLPGTSFFDLDSAQPSGLAALGRSAPRHAGLPLDGPTLRPGADGDEIVWAQELLNAAGARLPVGGFFGAQTERALVRFQGRHRLRRDGLLDAPTWRALGRLRAREPSWAAAPPLSALG
jgi:hypothetical protein